MGATQRLKHDAGNQKLWELPGIRGLSPEPSSSNLVRENFGPGNFCEAWAPRSVGSTTRGAKNCGKFPGFAGCLGNLLRPTWSAKIWWTELFAKHGRHAAFEARRGDPQRMGNSGIRGLSWDLCCCKVVFGTFFFEGRSAKILEPEISAKHGRHAAFEARRGEPKVVVNSRDSRCVFGTFFVQLGPRKFWKRKFLKSMGTTQRWKQDAGRQKFCKISWLRGSPWDLCCCKVVFGTFFFEAAKWGGKGGEASLLRFRHSTFSTTDKKTCASSSVRAPGLVLSRGGVWPRPPVPLPLLSPLVLWLQLLRPPKPPLPNRRLSEELLSIWSRFILPFVFCNFELEPAILRLKRPSATTIVSNLFDKNRLSKFFSSLYNIYNTPHLPYV